ncbi:LOW QUALITY PROTEIN: fringe glycosyltransferase [Amyelois transitella]|uniref:LOW QUALITY PROTEIN: fringe glycosyltransferase n=1 Tax=Amyelois transitella TaxID=680683 RepID=UPI0029905017|nr:LOW QUALITY PROTEIN: fringe glycosyltransferase [Amyelois transitella]
MSDKVLRLSQAYRCSAPSGSGMGGRRMIKAAIVLIALGYCSLLVYQGGVSFNFQERPVQVGDLSIEPVTKTSVLDSGQNKNITLDDIFISVKTTKHYQDTRLPIILKTWFQLAKEQTWFFTDTDNPKHQNQTNGHMVNTNCPASHQSEHLCCKMSVEYDYFLESGKKWFCHFDDDNYVNVPRLVKILQNYNHQEDWYLGRTSVSKPVKIFKKPTNKLWFSFWFATGGAGFCISRSLALKMLPIASGGRFITVCEGTRLPDDMSIGFIIEYLMKKNMTPISEFHSHYEQMKLLPSETFKDQISFSYAKTKNEWNVVNVPGFDTRYDPTRFLSLHCFLFPQFKFCPR